MANQKNHNSKGNKEFNRSLDQLEREIRFATKNNIVFPFEMYIQGSHKVAWRSIF